MHCGPAAQAVNPASTLLGVINNYRARHGVQPVRLDSSVSRVAQDWANLHFTALVWKSTDRIGVGLSQGRSGSYLVVNSAPAGNVLSQFRANVRPPH